MPFDHFSGHTIGIIGAGHLGRALALSLVGAGFPGKILISHAGNFRTLDEIRSAGLADQLTDNLSICREATIIFIAVRPQSVPSLKKLPLKNDTLVVSCMAGIMSECLREFLGVPVVRVMPSGPETLTAHKGIVGMFPHNAPLAELFSLLGQEVYEMPDEKMLGVFTAGVCLPAVILAAQGLGHDVDREMDRITAEFPITGPVYAWAKKAVPVSASGREQDEYIDRMSTKGGVTEAIVGSLRNNATLYDAFCAGIRRERELGEEAGKVLR